jgi:hypothetical protein
MKCIFVEQLNEIIGGYACYIQKPLPKKTTVGSPLLVPVSRIVPPINMICMDCKAIKIIQVCGGRFHPEDRTLLWDAA